MPHHMTAGPDSVQRETDPVPPVSIRIGGVRVEMDHVPHLPRWLTTIATSLVLVAAVYVTHHLHYWR
jgi:hypothetical protein